MEGDALGMPSADARHGDNNCLWIYPEHPGVPSSSMPSTEPPPERDHQNHDHPLARAGDGRHVSGIQSNRPMSYPVAASSTFHFSNAVPGAGGEEDDLAMRVLPFSAPCQAAQFAKAVDSEGCDEEGDNGGAFGGDSGGGDDVGNGDTPTRRTRTKMPNNYSHSALAERVVNHDHDDDEGGGGGSGGDGSAAARSSSRERLPGWTGVVNGWRDSNSSLSERHQRANESHGGGLDLRQAVGRSGRGQDEAWPTSAQLRPVQIGPAWAALGSNGLVYVDNRPRWLTRIQLELPRSTLEPIREEDGEKLIDFKAVKPGDVVGCDVSGYVVSIGRNVDAATFNVGDRVATFVHAARVPREGGFSEHASTIPAACTPPRSGSANAGVDELAPGTPFLIWSAASSTGCFAVQLAKMKGLQVIATCSPRNEAYVRGLGADVILDYTDRDVARKVREAAAAHAGPTHAFDMYSGGNSFALVESCLDAHWPGHIATIISGVESAITRTDVTTSIMQAWNALGRAYLDFMGQVVDVNEADHKLAKEMYRELGAMVKDGRIKPSRVKIMEGGLGAVEAGEMDLVSLPRSNFESLRPSIKDALVVIDEPMEQIIKWSCPGGFGFFFDCGVIEVKTVDSITNRGFPRDNSRVRYPPPRKVLFLLSTHLARHAENIQSALASGGAAYRECRILSALPESSHAAELDMEPELASAFDAYLGFTSYFGRVEGKVYSWMVERLESNGEFGDVKVSVDHMPLLYTTITGEMFTIPSSTFMFPNINAISDYSKSQQVKSLEAPTSFDKSTRQLAFSLGALLETFNLKEEIFVMGDLSKQLGRCIISQSMNAPRRKSENGVGLILIDRTLDLVAPTMHSDNLIDQMNRILTSDVPGSIDFNVEADLLLSDLPPGGANLAGLSLAHGSDPDSIDLMHVLTMLAQREGLVVVRKRLVDLIAKEAPEGKPRVLGKVTLTQMEKLLGVFRGNEDVIMRHGSLLQCIAAAVQTMRDSQSSNWDDLVSIEKVIGLSLAETGDAASAIQPIRDMVLKAASSNSSPPSRSIPGSPAVSPLRPSTINSNTGSPPSAPRLSTSSRQSSAHSISGAMTVSALDVLMLAAFSYALMGGALAVTEDDEMMLSDTLAKSVFVGVDGGAAGAVPGVDMVARERKRGEIDAWVGECMTRLQTVSRCRANLHQYSELLSRKSTPPYQSLIRRIISDIIANVGQSSSSPATLAGRLPTETDDLAHIPYGGTLGTVLSGFRVRPSQYSTLIVFVVGGVTVGEVRDVRELTRDAPIKVLVGGTRVVNGEDVLAQLFPPVPQ
ncbi:Sec1 domain-containing protein 2, partial [Irineochytrium annulatum]